LPAVTCAVYTEGRRRRKQPLQYDKGRHKGLKQLFESGSKKGVPAKLAGKINRRLAAEARRAEYERLKPLKVA